MARLTASPVFWMTGNALRLIAFAKPWPGTLPPVNIRSRLVHTGLCGMVLYGPVHSCMPWRGQGLLLLLPEGEQTRGHSVAALAGTVEG